jgi:orotidine-5'-phosphate decarboxylase
MTEATSPNGFSMAARLYVALDTQDLARAEQLAAAVAPAGASLKLGLEFFSAHGPAGVAKVKAKAPQSRLFLDLKFHDIPNTVASAVRAALAVEPYMLNVHAAGGPAMLRAAKDAADDEATKRGIARPLVIAVTVLTSLDDADLAAVGQTPPTGDQVKRLAALTQSCGLDGVVCSAHEAAILRALCGPGFRLVVPGIRPKGADVGDQKRVMGPLEAIQAGASDLVVGRPITGADVPADAARAIAAEMAG